MSGSTSVAPLASLLAKAYLKQYPGRVKFKLAQGGSDVGVADVAAGRVTIGNSSRDPKSSDPGGLVFNKIAKDAICIVTNPANPLAEPLAGADPGDLLRQGPRLGRGARRDGRPARSTSSSAPPASGTQDAFQKIFMGSKTVSRRRRAKASNGLVQQAVQSDKNAIGYVSLDFVGGTERGRLQRRRLQPAQRQVRRVRRRAQLLDGHARRAPTGQPSQKFITWVQNSPTAQKIVAHALGAAEVDARRGSAEPWPDRRAERMLGALACVVLLVIVADGRLRRSQGVAVVPRTTACAGSAPAATSTSSSTTWSTRRANPTPPTTTLARLAADLRRRS